MVFEVVPVVAVIVFWIIVFVVLMWFIARALRAPIPVEDEETHGQTEQPDHTAANEENAGAPVDQTRPANPVR